MIMLFYNKSSPQFNPTHLLVIQVQTPQQINYSIYWIYPTLPLKEKVSQTYQSYCLTSTQYCLKELSFYQENLTFQNMSYKNRGRHYERLALLLFSRPT